jgi:uncharacterized protein YhbP (UPF0306 family)
MKKIEKKLELVSALLSEETTLTLATTNEAGEAAATPLFYLAGEGLGIYWLSSPKSGHSLNLLRKAEAAVTVYRSAASWKEICGVQMRGRVGTVTEPARRKALLASYCERFKLGGVFSLAIRQSALYGFEAEWIRYIDNAKRFGYKFELENGADGWQPHAAGLTAR